MQDEAQGIGPEPVTADKDFLFEQSPHATGAPGGPGREEIPPTGEPRVDEAIAGLGRLAGLPLAEQVTVFEDTHAQLRQVLSELDSGPAGPGGGAGPAGGGH